MAYNFTAVADSWIQTNIVNTEKLLWYNYVQGYLGQDECTNSYTWYTATLNPQCFAYAWVFRPVIANILVTSVIISAFVFGFTFIVWKSSLETSGEYATIQDNLEEENDANGTTKTFP